MEIERIRISGEGNANEIILFKLALSVLDDHCTLLAFLKINLVHYLIRFVLISYVIS